MKKIFLLKRNALISSTGISWGVLALLGAGLLLLVRLLAPNFFWHTFTPVFKISDALTEKTDTLLKSFGDTATLAQENERLLNENASLFLQNQTLLEKVESTSSLEGIKAGIVARPPVSPYDTLVLAAGSRAGVVRGMEAFGEGGTPLGVISAVLEDFSRVTLFSAPGVVTNGWIGVKKLPIILEGVGAGGFSASVSRSAGIVAGDQVALSGPGHLLVGVVTRVDSDPSSPSITLRIMPIINPFSLSWVELRNTGGKALFTTATSTLP